jgi:hypothetical protein
MHKRQADTPAERARASAAGMNAGGEGDTGITPAARHSTRASVTATVPAATSASRAAATPTSRARVATVTDTRSRTGSARLRHSPVTTVTARGANAHTSTDEEDGRAAFKPICIVVCLIHFVSPVAAVESRARTRIRRVKALLQWACNCRACSATEAAVGAMISQDSAPRVVIGTDRKRCSTAQCRVCTTPSYSAPGSAGTSLIPRHSPSRVTNASVHTHTTRNNIATLP